MTTMIERVARAIAEKDRPADVSQQAWWAIRGDNFIEKARAAIEAMREPTDFMVQRGLGWREHDIPDHWPDEARIPYGTWKSMIDAMLSE